MSTMLRLDSTAGFDTVVLDSPHNRNALSVELLTSLIGVVERSAASTSRGLLVTHNGGSFCSGVDLKERRALPTSNTSHSTLLAALLRELWHFPKPVIVRVDGTVRGGGMGLLACADVVLATPRSTFAYSEARVGVAPALVMAVTVPLSDSRRLVPRLLSASMFGPETARELGLVTEIVPEDDASVVERVLSDLRSGSPDALATIKRLARSWAEVDMDGLIEEMTALSADLFARPDAAEGMAAFAERRPTAWSVTDPAQRTLVAPS